MKLEMSSWRSESCTLPVERSESPHYKVCVAENGIVYKEEERFVVRIDLKKEHQEKGWQDSFTANAGTLQGAKRKAQNKIKELENYWHPVGAVDGEVVQGRY